MPRLSLRVVNAAPLLLVTCLLSLPALADKTPRTLISAIQSAISGGNVNVVLVDGVATLTGYANSASIQAAERAALKHEAVDSVINHIGNTM